MASPLPHLPDLHKATAQLAAVVRDFVADDAIPESLVEFAAAEALAAMRAHGWPPARALTHCRRVITTQISLRVAGRSASRHSWLDRQLPLWLERSYNTA